MSRSAPQSLPVDAILRSLLKGELRDLETALAEASDPGRATRLRYMAESRRARLAETGRAGCRGGATGH